MIRKRKEDIKKGSPPWMTTYSDLMTLVLVLFILLFAFSEVDANKFRMIADSFKGVFDYESAVIPFDEIPSSPVKNVEVPEDTQEIEKALEKKAQMEQLLKEIKGYLDEHDLEGVVTATGEERGIVLVLQENVLFDSGKAVIKDEAKPFLEEMAKLIRSLPNQIEVEGHTDSHKVIQPSQYISNWNLSGDRAANVVNYFTEQHQLPGERFKIAGYADTQPVATNATEEGRMRNRRVIIVILDVKIGQE